MIVRNARAKINLGLKIVDKRPDGYHNIETTMTTISLCDRVIIDAAESGIEVNTAGLKIKPEKNTCFQAAKLVLEEKKCTAGVKITIQKNIPVGGGLAGGSSDAAEVIKGINELYRLNLGNDEMCALAAAVGCDAPFFIRGGAAYVRGKGDQLKFFRLPKMSLVVYYPGYPVATRWAYEEYDRQPAIAVDFRDVETTGKTKKKKEKADLTGFGMQNDFEKVVFRSHPDLQDVKVRLLAAGAFMAALSGSGSCLYAVVDDNTRSKVVKYLTGIGAVYFEVETV